MLPKSFLPKVTVHYSDLRNVIASSWLLYDLKVNQSFFKFRFPAPCQVSPSNTAILRTVERDKFVFYPLYFTHILSLHSTDTFGYDVVII